MGRIPLLIIATLLLASTHAGAEPKVWQYSASGQWEQSQQGAATQPAARAPTGPIANPTLDRAQRLLNARRYDAAHDVVLDWLKRSPQAPDRDRGLFLMAESYYATGDRLWCFYECDELLDTYPDSRRYFAALELQYRVADAFLNGYKKSFLGLPIVGMTEEGIEMLYRIQERSPGSPVAEKSLLRSAHYYYRSSDFDLAADAYGAFVRAYPRSAEVPRAKLREAYSNFAQYRGHRYDPTALLDARAQFQDTMNRFPGLAREEGLQAFIDKIDDQLAAKIYWTADYYRRTNNPRAAVFVYRSLLQQYPTSRDADAARKALAKMPKWALNEPPPPTDVGRVPTTRPTELPE